MDGHNRFLVMDWPNGARSLTLSCCPGCGAWHIVNPLADVIAADGVFTCVYCGRAVPLTPFEMRFVLHPERYVAVEAG